MIASNGAPSPTSPRKGEAMRREGSERLIKKEKSAKIILKI